MSCWPLSFKSSAASKRFPLELSRPQTTLEAVRGNVGRLCWRATSPRDTRTADREAVAPGRDHSPRRPSTALREALCLGKLTEATPQPILADSPKPSQLSLLRTLRKPLQTAERRK